MHRKTGEPEPKGTDLLHAAPLQAGDAPTTARQTIASSEPDVATPPDGYVLGIRCPACGAQLNEVSFTRQFVNQTVRSRKCPKCRRRWRTSERLVLTPPLDLPDRSRPTT